MTAKKEAIETLREKGHRVTHLREVLIDYLLQQSGHWHIQDMGERLMKKYPSVGIATIYRTVNLLVDEGFLTKTEMGTGPARYEVTPTEHHDHLTCLDCGLIVEFENDKIEDLQEKTAKKLGFELVDHTMELYGRCPEAKTCTRKRNK